ncbi:MAG: glycosyltransferase [Cyclobacteriaceae bacterium]
MKILQLIQRPQLRGAEIFASQLSQNLAKAGHDVVLVTLFAGEASLPFSGTLIPLNRPVNKRIIDWDGWKAFSKLVDTMQPDIVQANAGDTLKFAVLSKFFFGWKAKIVFRNANMVSDFVKSAPKRLFNRFLVSHVDYVISVSELCRQDFITTYSYRPDKNKTKPIGIEISPMQDNPAGLPELFQSDVVLIHAASFVPEKNHAGLLRIFKLLNQHVHGVKLALLGDGRLRTRIEQQVSELGLQDHVSFLGYRKDAKACMKEAFALLLPSLIEGLPGVILEAMYCKTPVVAYDVGGIREVIVNKETGWLVKKNDETGFVNAVLEVLRGDNVDRITDNAYTRVVNEFDNAVIARRFEEIYYKLINKHG